MASFNLSYSSTSLSCPRACKQIKLFNGLHYMNSSFANGHRSDLPFIHLNSKFSPSDNGVRIPKATLIFGGGDLLSYSNGNDVMISKDLNGHESVGLEVQPDEIAFGALVGNTVVTTNDFPVDEDEFDLDCPTEGFASIPEAIEDIRQGKVDYCLWLCLVLPLFLWLWRPMSPC